MAEKRNLLASIFGSIARPIDDLSPHPGQRIRVSGRRLRIPLSSQPIQLELGGERLQIQKQIRLDRSCPPGAPELVVFNPHLDPGQINYSLLLGRGEHLHISHDQDNQEHLFQSPREAFRRDFHLEYDGDSLVFRDSISEPGTYITLLDQRVEESPIVAGRMDVIDKIVDLYGGSLEAMPPEPALTTIQEVNDLQREDAFRKKDAAGAAGGLLQLPGGISPVIVGDLHANIDNLLRILGEPPFMQGLERRTCVLVFLGDLVQPDCEPYDSMDSSVLMMDLLFKLKLRFPDGVFFLRGNHDSFSAEVSKNLVPQGLLWRKKLEQVRGEQYCHQMQRFYDSSPVVAISTDFVACHAGPPQYHVDLERIVNLRTDPDLVHDLTWRRLRRTGRPTGYAANDVRRFRRSLGLPKEFPFVVSHTRYSETDTIWCDVAGIRGHHIVYSADSERFGVFIRVNGQMVPQLYTSEPLLEWINRRVQRASRDTR